MPKSLFTDAYASLLNVLVDARKEAGLTQVELARRLDKPQQFISYYERGERRLDVIEFYAITKALGAEPEDMFRRVITKLPKKVAI